MNKRTFAGLAGVGMVVAAASMMLCGLPMTAAAYAGTRSLAQTDTSTWKTYRSEKHGFGLKYPESWSVHNCSGSMESVAPKPSLESMASADATSSDRSVDTSSWKTYRNEKQGFELKYPETWTVNVGSGTTEIIVITKPHREGELKASLTLAIQKNQNPKKLHIEDWFAEQLKLIHATPESTGRTTVGGQDAVFMENTNSFGKQRATFTLLHATDVLSLSYKRQAELDDIYTAMTSSFRVID